MMNMIKSLFIHMTFNMSLLNEPSEVFSFLQKKFDPMNLSPDYRVKKTSTPIHQTEIVDVLCKSHISEYGKAPSNNRLALSWAQIALENNRGKKIWNNNIGNQGPFRMDQEYYHHLRKGWPYRSFSNLEDSGRSYWRVISKCSSALRAFDDGDPARAAISLKNCNYFGTDVSGYTRTLNSLYYEAKSRVIPKVGCNTTLK